MTTETECLRGECNTPSGCNRQGQCLALDCKPETESVAVSNLSSHLKLEIAQQSGTLKIRLLNMLRMAEELEEDKAAHAREVGELEDRIDELSARHIHTCGPYCKREMCVARRDAKRYQKARALCCSESGPPMELVDAWANGDEAAADKAIDAAMPTPTREVIT